MGRAVSGGIADDDAAFIAACLADPTSVLRLATDALLARADDVRGLTVFDLGCGEGHLSRVLAARGAVVVRVDLSAPLRSMASGSAGGEHGRTRFICDDAQRLASFGDDRCDVVVSNLALMDIPDLAAVYAAVRRIVRRGGRFVLSLSHPCFQGPDATAEVGGNGAVVALRVARYATEGFWRADTRVGIRGRVGAHHRTLATYLNPRVETGFVINGVVEPTLAPDRSSDSYAQGRVKIPSVWIVDARHP